MNLPAVCLWDLDRRWCTAVWCVFVACLSRGTARGQEPAAFIKQAERAVIIGNQFLELHFDTSSGRPLATSLLNRLSGETLKFRADDFSVGLEGRPPLRGADCALQQVRAEELPRGGKRLSFQLSASQPRRLTLDVNYELGARDFFLRRQLVLQTPEPLPLRRVDVWCAGVDGQAEHQGFGQPVLLESTFWGLEYPGGHDQFANGTLTLTHHPGRTVGEQFVSKTAVVGVARPGDTARQFERYLRTVQATPEDTRLFVNYNTWWTLMPPTEQNCRELIARFQRELFDKHKQSFDTFTIDEGWDDKNTLWQIQASRFPQGFRPLTEPLRAMQAGHGLWLSPSSGYNHAPWGAQAGYEHNSNAWFLCQSGPKYRQDIVRVVTEMARAYDIRFFKFDGFCASCEATGHGHLPGEFAREANIDAYIELLQAVRRTRPQVFLDLTCGIWLSPWWLMYADSLWGEVSGDYPDIIAPAPIVRDSATTTRDAVFRQRCRQHPGFPPAAIEHLGIIVISPEKWEDNAMIVLGRGCRLLTLYINPQHFQHGDRDWAFLGSILRWVRHHSRTLENTELILGDPLAREPYGYAHWEGNRGIVALRNPFIEPRTVRLVLDESFGWQRPAAGAAAPPLVARVVYPYHQLLAGDHRYGAAVECLLQGYETKVLQFEPADQAPALPVGIPYVERERAGNRLTLDVYGRPGQRFTFRTPSGGSGITKVTFQGQVVEVRNRQVASAPLAFPEAAGKASVRDAKLEAQTIADAGQFVGSCTVEVPPASKATMHVLFDPKGRDGVPVDCAARVDGRPVAVRAVRSPDKPGQTHGTHPWTWFEFDIPPGSHAIALTIRLAKPTHSFLRGEVGWWLWLEHPRAAATVTVEYQQPPTAPEPLPLPISTATERQVLTIQAARVLRAGNRWPKADQAAMRLDEHAPDEASQEWGHLERNRSVWQKEMVIAGKKFSRGLGTHANGRMLYELTGAGFRRFHAVVGRDEHAGDGRIVFQVWVDGQRRFDSGPMTNSSPAQPVDVDLTGAATLELRTLDGGDGISGDHGNWAEAELRR
jgi:hypothetical protein